MTAYTVELPLAGGTVSDSACSVEVASPDRVASLGAPLGELRDDEAVIAAFDDEAAIGYLFCSLNAAHSIGPLEQECEFDGAYIRRVFVDPDHRQRGVARSLLRNACQWASDGGARRATALVARDNVPSRRLFEREGFEPEQRHVYIRFGPFAYRRRG
ncbi:MAG: GNAT family N-acetyltransferase [Halobellus sp.]|uniref:GNAT family N-acetyltransferase n=1 Tax=Halobellus sp. TaxID=1979212 RepID=UPI0035D4D908